MSDAENPIETDRFRVDEQTLAFRRLIPTFLGLAREAWPRGTAGRSRGDSWEESIVPLMDPPDYDSYEDLPDEPIVDGNVEDALQALIERVIAAMTEDEPATVYDAALAHRGRILAVVRNSPGRPVVTRLDGEPPVPPHDGDGPPAGDEAGGDADLRRARWVPDPQAQVAPEYSGPRRSLGAWLDTIAALIDGPEKDPERIFPRRRFRDGDLAGGLEGAIAVACEAMAPTSGDDAPRGPRPAEPLTRDVALAAAGRIHAVVQYSEAGPIVHRFRDLWPGLA